jgi:hypothetical protein
VPHWMTSPHPSEMGPQAAAGRSAQVSGVHRVPQTLIGNDTAVASAPHINPGVKHSADVVHNWTGAIPKPSLGQGPN